MTYVIGDVHGCYDELMSLLLKIDARDPDAIIYFVGDFIDRGPKVYETLEWAMTHISENGKYRSVQGNHEDMAILWFEKFRDSWPEIKITDKKLMEELPYVKENFAQLMKRYGNTTPESVKKYIDFFKGLPYKRTVQVISKFGERVTYHIVHGAFEYWNENGDEQSIMIENLWGRSLIGYPEIGKIVVHGHTPSTAYHYFSEAKKLARPGMIVFASNDINVDGGCFTAYKTHLPARLSAICLETLDEIYHCTLEERLMEIETYKKHGIDMDSITRRVRWYDKRYGARNAEERLKLYEKLSWKESDWVITHYESPPIVREKKK